jgi:hypothetical protein
MTYFAIILAALADRLECAGPGEHVVSRPYKTRAMSNRYRRFVLLVPAMCCVVLSAAAQEPTERWKQQNTVDGRVEGFELERDVAAGALILVDFHAYREPFDFVRDSQMIVEFFAWEPRRASRMPPG